MGNENRTIWNQAAANAASTTFGTALGMIFGKSQDKRQLDQQERLQKLQLRGEGQMMDMRAKKDYEMWLKTNYPGQVEQLKKAGLNPGLMYGMGGGGGTTTGNSSGGVSGGQAAGHSGEVQAAIGMGLQMRLQEAQIKVMESQANKNNVEAGKTEGVDTDESKTRIASLTQGIENQKAVAELTKVQTQIGKIDLWVKDKSKEDAADIIMWQADKIMNEVEALERENIVDRRTMIDRIGIVKEELAIKVLQQQVMKVGIGYTKAATKTEGYKQNLIGEQTTTEGYKQDNLAEDEKLKEQQWKGLIREGIQKWKTISLQGEHIEIDKARQLQEAWVNDVQNSLKIPVNILEQVAQGIIFKNIIKK